MMILQKFENYFSREGFLDLINGISASKYNISKINAYNGKCIIS